MELPLVSIIITSYNRATSIGQSIQSALDQDYPNLEIVISDNCSSDNSDEIIRNFNDKRIRYNRNETNMGMFSNFEKAICELASGDYFVIVNSDDYLTNSNFIKDAIQLVNKYKDVFIVKSNYRLLENETGKIKNANLNFEEFNEGKFWLKQSKILTFEKIIETLNWAGVLINKKEFIKLNIFEMTILNFDTAAGALLLLKGNICFINEYSYMFRYLINRKQFQTEDVNKEYRSYFHALDSLVLHEYNNIYGSLANHLYNRYYTYAVKYYAYLLYIYNRDEFQKFKIFSKNNYNDIFIEITSTVHWRLFSLMHYNKKIGKIISSLLKIKIINKS